MHKLTDTRGRRTIIIGGKSHHKNKEATTLEAVKDYTVHIDSKKRVTLRGATYQYYNVKEYTNGCIMLEPRELKVPESISAKTLKDMDRAIANFKQGTVSDAVELSDFQ